MKKGSKPRLALFGVGTLGGGHSWQGAPVQAELFQRLSIHYDIVFYSFSQIKMTHIPSVIQVRQISSSRLPGRLKYLLLLARAVMDHLASRFSLIFSVSVYPSGLFAVVLGRIIKRSVLLQLIASEAVSPEHHEYGRFARRGFERITAWVLEKADFVVFVADFQRDIAIKCFPSIKEIAVLPLRINVAKFPYRDRSLSFPVEFIHVAHYSPIKDQDMMFRALAMVARVIDCHLTVIGSGFDAPHVVKMLEALNISDKVRAPGVVLQADLPRYYDAAHILLHTARFETGCAAIQEAMACGVVVCGTHVGILADIGDQYAVSVPSGDAEALAGEILRLVADPDLYQRLSNNAHKWITDHDAAWAAQNYHTFISRVIPTDQ